jgi:hypothetical protein
MTQGIETYCHYLTRLWNQLSLMRSDKTRGPLMRFDKTMRSTDELWQDKRPTDEIWQDNEIHWWDLTRQWDPPMSFDKTRGPLMRSDKTRGPLKRSDTLMRFDKTRGPRMRFDKTRGPLMRFDKTRGPLMTIKWLINRDFCNFQLLKNMTYFTMYVHVSNMYEIVNRQLLLSINKCTIKNTIHKFIYT